MFFMMNVTAVPNLTFGHELGHNLGLDHDWVAEPEPGKYPYAHGWIPPSKKWRTIMAYPGGCAGCERINRYSDATATYQGEPLGAPDTAAQPSDAVRMIRRNAPVVAAMQPEKTPAVYCRLTVKSTPDTGGSATVDVPGPYTKGSLVHATATANPNHRLIGWSLNGTALADTDTSVSVPVDADSVLEARFAQVDCALTLRTQPADGGTVTADRPAPYRCGSTVTLTATPTPGWTFTGWNSETGPAGRGLVATTPVHQLTLDQDTALTATFTRSDVVVPTPTPTPTPTPSPSPSPTPTPTPSPSPTPTSSPSPAPTPTSSPTPTVPNPPVPPSPDQQSVVNPPPPPGPPVPARPTPSATESARSELPSTGLPVPLVATALTAGLAMTAGGILVARRRRRVRG
ncbi:InlB B-repeat-containing protein [Kitasatospora albolonga]